MKVMCVNSSLNAGKLNLKSFHTQEPEKSSEPIEQNDKKMLSYDKSYYMNNSTNVNFKRVTTLPILNDAEAKSLIQATIAKVEKLDDKRLVKDLKKCMDNLSQYGAEYYYSNRRKDHRNVCSIKLFSIQAINKLIDHPIMKIDNIKNNLYNIWCNLVYNDVDIEMLKSEQLLDFVNFLVSKKAKPLMEHPSVQKNTYKLIEFNEYLRARVDDDFYLICRQKVAEEMVKSPKLFDDKNFDFANFIYQIRGIDLYNKIYISYDVNKPHLDSFCERIENLYCGELGIKENDHVSDIINQDLNNRLLEFKKKQTKNKT